MRWRRETYDQRNVRLARDGEKCFAWLPTVMTDGTVVWLEEYWRAIEISDAAGIPFTSSPPRIRLSTSQNGALSDWARREAIAAIQPLAAAPTSPPPPKPQR